MEFFQYFTVCLICKNPDVAYCTDVFLLQKGSGIPLPRKLCYAIGGMPYQMTSNAKGFFMQIFLLDVVQVRC